MSDEFLKEAMNLLTEVEAESAIKSKAMDLYFRYINFSEDKENRDNDIEKLGVSV
ncbi:hypothetical protein [Helicovermis profundi]|uniref:Uncharacterized protein n=1 Tax=Helicovermis profundi TaxID=3065157 RepID=A0AAU9ES41_9FIRM|nr:hypothetical protein HLPR_16060 [Clostridia bacterium S502]